MASKLTQPAQETSVTGGLALGLLALGVREISSDKIRFEFAFSHAWRGFPARSDFPRIARTTGMDPYYQIAHDHSRRTGYLPVAVFTKASPGLELSIRRPDWFTFDEARDQLERDSGVPWEQWQQLAQDFADHYFKN